MPSPFRSGSPLDRLFGGVEQRALPSPDQYLYSGYGVPALYKPAESIDAYGDSVWLYRSVLTLSIECARIPLKLRKKNTKNNAFVERHQCLDLLARPQETKTGKVQLTGMMLRVITHMHEFLNGEGFWVFQKRLPANLGGGPVYVDLARPQYVFEKLDKDGEISEYVYRVSPAAGPRSEISLDPLDVVHFRLPSPKNWLRGHSPLQGIRHAVDGQRKADLMNVSKLDNYGAPGGVLETDQAVPPDERQKLLSEWRQNFAGAKNAGKVAFMPKGLKFNKTQETNQDMQYVEGKSVTRDEILANYGVGLEIMGRTESQTRANAEAAIFVFQRFGVLPYMELFVDALNNDYLPAFPGTDNLEFVFDDPVPENLEDKRATSETLMGGGALTPNEQRKMFGLEPLNLPGMDVPYLPIGLAPVGEAPPPLVAPPL
jgi:HK97 family phage portal protein